MTLAHLDAIAEEYDVYRRSASQELYDLLREQGIGQRTRVLDVGVGTGLAAEPLIAAGAIVTGVDPSAAMLARARARIPRADLVVGRAESLPFGAASFDAAIAADVFHLLDDQEAALAEMIRIVRPGGLVAIWWPIVSNASDILAHRAGAANELQLPVIADPLVRGFRKFYAAPFRERTVRIVPGMVETTVESWLGFERTRAEVYITYGDQAERWFDVLEGRLLRAHGAPEARLRERVLYYVYLGRV